jgi:hypothetical protein
MSNSFLFGAVSTAISRTHAIAMLTMLVACSAWAQPARNTTSADAPETKSLFESAGQAGVGPRPYTSFLERLSSPVDKIIIKLAADNLPADGVTGTDVRVQLMDIKGTPVRTDVDVTIEVDGGARILLPGRATPESGADKSDIDRVTPGVQFTVKNGLFSFKLIAPYKPEAVNLRVSVKGVVEKTVVRYVPDLREMIVVGLIEGQARSDKFDPKQIVPVRDDDSFDKELKAFSKDFNGGKTRIGARAAMYLKGKIKGDYLLTLSYDSEKDTRDRLFRDIDPNAFYPVYGDSSIRGVDAQSSTKLYVRLDKNRSYLLYGDYTTQDTNPARALSQYSRSLPGLRGHYEEGKVTANTFVARQAFKQVVDEFPARGVSGPYSVSNPNGIAGSEKIEILVRDRFRASTILRATTLTRDFDYAFEPFGGQILFKSPIPSVDDQLNPVSIRVTYEVEQGGQRFNIYGGDVQVKVSEGLALGVAAARDSNPAAPFTVAGANVLMRLGKSTELLAEVARSSSEVNTNAFNTNSNSTYAGQSGKLTGNAGRVELRHSDDQLRARIFGVQTDKEFNNPSSGTVGGRTEIGVSGGYKLNENLAINADLLRSKDRVNNIEADAASVSLDWTLKLSDSLTLGAGARHAKQNAQSLTTLTNSTCSNGTTNTISGFNTGFGINQQGNQNIDPATGRPIVCSPTSLSTATAPTGLDASSLYARLTWQATERLTAFSELQKEFNTTDDAFTYKLGADYRLADKTRLYARYDYAHQYNGYYGLGVGPRASSVAVGLDTQYMEDGSLYSEYRIRDAANGKEVAAAVGLRNGWRVAEGLRLTTSFERTYNTVNNTTGPTGSFSAATAAALGVEYTASELWKGSGRIEWRRDISNVNWLLTAGVARKLDRNWTLLGREYLTLIEDRNTGDAVKRQSRIQLGLAYRPVDNNKFDALGMYENRRSAEWAAGAATAFENVDIVSLRGNYHPTRAWWLSGRYAYKRVNELLSGTGVRDSYRAQLFGARVTYDITNRWSVGVIGTMLQDQFGSRQYAYGLEAGYVLMDNLWATLGYNWRGFRTSDTTFTGNEYTNRGWVLGVRYKFDEDLFKRGDADVNRTRTPATPTPAAK